MPKVAWHDDCCITLISAHLSSKDPKKYLIGYWQSEIRGVVFERCQQCYMPIVTKYAKPKIAQYSFLIMNPL